MIFFLKMINEFNTNVGQYTAFDNDSSH